MLGTRRPPATVTPPSADTVAAGWPAARGTDAGERRWLLAAVALGVAVRAAHVLRADFPLNDGGLFYQMTRDLQAAGFRLPAVTSYNGAGLPFAYPPFAFYLAGALDRLTPLGLMSWFRILPLLAAAATMVAFVALARPLVGRAAPLVAAVVAFAILPRSFIWNLMGGGVTRSFGLLFAILALWQVERLYTRRSWRYLPAATVFAALTILSHLETGWFLAYSIAVFFLALGRHRFGVYASAALALGTLLLTAPWWAAVLHMHGVGPFLAAQATGGSVFTDGGARIYLLLNVLRLGQGYTGETLFPVAGSLAVLGALACALRRRWLLPAWWAVILVMDARAFATYATLPVAMLAGIGLADVLLPALRGLVGPWNARPITLRDLTAGRAALILGGGVLLASLAAASNDDHLGGENVFLVPLSPDERAAMRWVAAETPPDSRFLLVTAGVWPADKQSEWFPVLARRPSVATVQGYEWVPGGAFARLVEAYDEVQTGGCSATDSACLDRWSAEHGIAFTHVYVPNTPRGQCCDRLRRSLANDPRYVTLMDGPGAAIFARRDTAEPPVVACARDGAPSGRDPADTTRLTAGRAGSFLAAGC